MRTKFIHRWSTALAAASLLSLGAAGCGSSDDDNGTPAPGTDASDMDTTPATPNLIEVATEAGSFGTLLAALEAADLTSVLEGDGPFTVFAPTDAAFEALLTELGATAEQLLARDDLSTILLYHVIGGAAVGSSSVTTGPATTAADLSVWINADNGVRVNGATVSTPDVTASNGVIHIVDSVILPANIAEFAGYTGQHGSLLAAVGAAGIAGAVTDPAAKVTVFAPTDAAFTAALTALGLTFEELAADTDTLTTILTYHVVGGEVLSPAVVGLDGEQVEMLSGESALVDATALTIGGAALNADLLDIRTTTGVIHVLNDVMVPPSITQ
jgi:transforming growth factor-beta-induced protein